MAHTSTHISQAPGGTSTLDIYGGYTQETSVHHPSIRERQMAPAGMYPERRGAEATDMGMQHQMAAGQHVSSNAWASNASQNCGNMLSERSSTRIHSVPGGVAAMGSSFGWSEEAPAQSGRQHESSNSWASNASQNCGNMLSERSSTRIHQPPGGKNSMGSSFGWSDETSAPQPMRESQAPNILAPEPAPFVQKQQSVNQHANLSGSQMQQQMSGAEPQQHVSSNAWASNASQNCGNMLSERSSTRIHQPPGGKNSMGTSFAW